jgi:hypothetical protein
VKYIYKVCAPGISGSELKSLRKEVEKSLSDPDHVIVTNYEFSLEIVPLLSGKKKKK